MVNDGLCKLEGRSVEGLPGVREAIQIGEVAQRWSGKGRPHLKPSGGAGHLISLWSEPATGDTTYPDTFSAALLPSDQIALGISTGQPEEVGRPFLRQVREVTIIACCTLSIGRINPGR
jgi:hypothetical protein